MILKGLRENIIFAPQSGLGLLQGAFIGSTASHNTLGIVENAYASSEEDVSTNCLMCKYVEDVKPRALDSKNAYQQFEFSAYQGCTSRSIFLAKYVASNGCPPCFLRRHGWQVKSRPASFPLGEANGIIDSSLHTCLPDFDFPRFHGASEPIVVGNWSKDGRGSLCAKKPAGKEAVW